MKIRVINHTHWTSEKKSVYSLVFRKFEVTLDAITATEEKAEALIEFFGQASAERAIFENMTLTERLSDLRTVLYCTKYLMWSKVFIRQALEEFTKVMDLVSGYLFGEFFDFAEQAIKLFISIEKETKRSMNEIQEVSEKFRNIARIGRS